MTKGKSRRLWWKWLACSIILIGALYRAQPLTTNRYHSDEALFTTLARTIANGTDPLLTQTKLLVDKPPLAYYSLALAIALGGSHEIVVRVPSFLASLLTMALVARISFLVWRTPIAALFSLFFAALSPFAISFAPTAFSDSIMVALALGSLAAVLDNRYLLSGILLGLAIFTKQNAVFLIPLIMVTLIVSQAPFAPTNRNFTKFALGLLAVFAAGLIWDLLRQPAVNSWLSTLGVNNPGRLARSTEISSRFEVWAYWLVYVTGSPSANAIAIATMSCAVISDLLISNRSSLNTRIFTAFCLLYFAIHFLIAFPILDRYLLPIIPIISLVAGRGVERLFFSLNGVVSGYAARLTAGAIGGLLICMMIVSGEGAAKSVFPVGGDHGSNDGIDSMATFARQLPFGTVIYSQKLDWAIRAYSFDLYVFPVYIDTPDQFGQDLRVFGETGPPRMLILSGSEPIRELERAAKNAGYEFEPVFYGFNRYGTTTIAAYRIVALNKTSLTLRAVDVN